ncbi:MAG: winged helix-turn-helix domain-containing protein, partial [Desulfurella sp.]
AKMKDILRLVHEKMKSILREYDYEPLPSNPKQERWKNTAQWARNTMVNEGLLVSNSPRGIWEITEEGRRFYNEKIITSNKPIGL